MALLKDSLIAHYKMNDDAATAVVVDATSDHNGTYKDAGGDLNTDTGASTGKINGALDFDGTDECIEIADHDDFTPALTPFSISAWVYMHDATSFPIATKGVYNTDGEWRFEVISNDKVRFVCFDESVAFCRIGRLYNTILTPYENSWIHLIGTYDGGILATGLKLYLNGLRVDDSSVETNPASFVSVENLNHDVWVGRYLNSFANGLIDNVMFFNKELTPLEVKYLYNGGAGVESIPTLVELSRTGQRFSSFPGN